MTQTRKQKVLEEVKKQRQRRRALSITIIAVVLIAVIGGGVYAFLRSSGSPNFPFQCLPQEQLSLHIHPWLRITINTGTSNISVPIPTAVGILDPQINNGITSGGSCFEPLHTHDASGIIHVESPSTSTQYTLDNFFQIWKVTYNTVNVNGVNQPIVFNRTDILGYKVDPTHTLSLLIDGGQTTYQNSTQYGGLVLNQLDYCSMAMQGLPPCSPTAGGDPYYGGAPYPFGTGHTIIIYYKTV